MSIYYNYRDSDKALIRAGIDGDLADCTKVLFADEQGPLLGDYAVPLKKFDAGITAIEDRTQTEIDDEIALLKDRVYLQLDAGVVTAVKNAPIYNNQHVHIPVPVGQAFQKTNFPGGFETSEGVYDLAESYGAWKWKYAPTAITARSQSEKDADNEANYFDLSTDAPDSSPPDGFFEISQTPGYCTLTIDKKLFEDDSVNTSETDTIYLTISESGYAIKDNAGAGEIASIDLASGTASFRLYTPATLSVECELKLYKSGNLLTSLKFISIA